MSELVDTNWLNAVIRGKIEWRKCPTCDIDGVELQPYNEYGKPCTDADPTALRDICCDCEGLAFIEVPRI